MAALWRHSTVGRTIGIKTLPDLVEMGEMRSAPKVTRRRLTRLVGYGLVTVLLSGACTGEATLEPPAKKAFAPTTIAGDAVLELPIPDWVDRQPFQPVLTSAGEWHETPIADDGRVDALADIDGVATALITSVARDPGRFRLYRHGDDGWNPATEWLWHENAPAGAMSWASIVAIDGAVVVVGSRNGSTGPASVLVDGAGASTYSPIFPAGDNPVKITKAASGGKILLAIASDGTRATLWRSVDGVTWLEVPLPLDWPRGTVLVDLVYANEMWAIAAQSRGSGRSMAVITSRDGVDWTKHTIAAPDADASASLKSIAHDGSAFVVIGVAKGGDAPHDVTWRSNTGTEWGPPIAPAPAAFGNGPINVRRSAASATHAVVFGLASFHEDLMYCYDEPTTCQSEFDAMWSFDGGEWHLMSLPVGIRPTSAATVDGVLYVGGRSEGRSAIFEWRPDGDALPFALPLDTAPPSLQLPRAGDQADLEPGVVYAWPTSSAACAFFNGLSWHIDLLTPDAARLIAESGAIAGNRIYATVELIAPERIELAIPGHGPIAYLSPMPRSGEGFGELGRCL